MKIRYLLASPSGDLLLTEHHLGLPFVVSRTQKHPFLTLGDYFKMLENFLLKVSTTDGAALFEKFLGSSMDMKDLHQIDICTEKHGALYHIARITLIQDKAQAVTLAATVGVTETARQFLYNEFNLLRSLTDTHTDSYLPRVYSYETASLQKQEGTEVFSCMFGEWLIDYHEWHLSDDPENDTIKICLWDTTQGNRFLSESAAYQIIKQAAAILTYYYDPQSGRMLWPWHHAAGDFIVRFQENSLDVKLITARNFIPLFDLADDETSIVTTLLGFLLLTTLRLRLDKLSGTGKAVWIDDYSVAAATDGIIESLKKHELVGAFGAGFTAEFIELLKYLDADALIKMCDNIEEYFAEDDEDLALVKKNIPAHCHSLEKVFKTLEKSQEEKSSEGDVSVRSPEIAE